MLPTNRDETTWLARLSLTAVCTVPYRQYVAAVTQVTVSLTAVCTVPYRQYVAAVTQVTLSPVELCVSLMQLTGSVQYEVALSVC
jgi:hypothetical protein